MHPYIQGFVNLQYIIFIKYLFQVRDSQGVVSLVIILQIIVCLQEMLRSTSALLRQHSENA